MQRTLRFVVVPCRLGHMLVAAGERGVCHLRFGDHAAALEGPFRRLFPGARLVTAARDPLRIWTDALVARLAAWDGRGAGTRVPTATSNTDAFAGPTATPPT